MPRSREQKKLSRWEILGAWLHLWTPPRDVDVPPVPWRAVGIGAAVLAVLTAVVVAFGIPAVNEHNKSADERERAAHEAQIRARLKVLAGIQIAHRSTTDPPTSVEERRALVRKLEAAILADAQTRVRKHEYGLKGPIRRVECSPGRRSGAGGVVPEDNLARVRAGYDCTAVTSDITGHAGAVIGYPFKGVVDFRTGALVWCRTNPPPGEQVIGDPGKLPQVPAECVDPGAS